MKAWTQSLLEDVRSLRSQGIRACERFGARVPAILRNDPSSTTLELFAEARAEGGAFRFHQWAASQLPPNVRAHYGDRFVLGAHQLLAGNFAVRSAIHHMFSPELKPSAQLDCPTCGCVTNGERADCLIRRFHHAYESIDSDYIAEWYFSLDGLAAKEVLAFFRNAVPSDPVIREAIEKILSRQVGLPGKVTVHGEVGNVSKSLRDAFMFTAMVAVHEWLDIKLAHKPKADRADDCAALVARTFGEKASTVRNRRKKLSPQISESIEAFRKNRGVFESVIDKVVRWTRPSVR